MGGTMIYCFFSSVFITLFITLAVLALMGYLEQMHKGMPLVWSCYQHVIALAVLAALCFIAAILIGAQIPTCYVPEGVFVQ